MMKMVAATATATATAIKPYMFFAMVHDMMCVYQRLKDIIKLSDHKKHCEVTLSQAESTSLSVISAMVIVSLPLKSYILIVVRVV